jgi:formiminotetrahydrofolate cyclodeaminase
MQDRLTELTVRELVERLATRDAVPGGGSAAALAGAMGAALVRMVVELTLGRGASDSADEVGRIGSAATTWQSELLNLADLDANAYTAVVEARRLPRGTELEAQARDVQVAAAMREATRAPLHTMRAATAVLELAEQLAPLGTPHAITDVGVGAALAGTAVRSAALNVRVNVPYVTDDELRAEATAALAGLPAIAERERAVAAVVEARIA